MPSSQGVGYGSGALVAVQSGRGYVATCNHVIAAAAHTPRVSFHGAGEFAARVLANDQANDLALLEIAAPGRQPIRISTTIPSNRLTAGGFGGDGRYRSVTGAVLGYARPAGATAASVRIAGAVRSGDSGGPVTNAAGEMVGVVWGVRGDASYATIGEPFRRLLQSVPAAAGPGMVRVAPRQAADREVNRRLLALEGKMQGMRPCRCRGDCLTEEALQALASKQDVALLQQETDQQHRGVLQRLGDVRSRAVQAAKAAAIEALSQQIGGRTPSVVASLPRLVGVALGVGGPVGVVAVGAGWWLASRRRRRRDPEGHQGRGERGQGGPRDGPFPGAATE